ncbi:hypothetical protein SDC9_157932 [bioreactor metagenome]|uniref:Uncharacterized protein n=1 Tax=bioreactor metagenome TaxID=1076179 RepID=A0A645F8T2_9ZZZZ
MRVDPLPQLGVAGYGPVASGIQAAVPQRARSLQFAAAFQLPVPAGEDAAEFVVAAPEPVDLAAAGQDGETGEQSLGPFCEALLEMPEQGALHALPQDPAADRADQQGGDRGQRDQARGQTKTVQPARRHRLR